MGGDQYCGGIMINVGDILSTMRGVQYHGGYHEYRGGVILSTMGGYHDVHGGYHEYRGGVQYHGRKSFVI